MFRQVIGAQGPILVGQGCGRGVVFASTAPYTSGRIGAASMSESGIFPGRSSVVGRASCRTARRRLSSTRDSRAGRLSTPA